MPWGVWSKLSKTFIKIAGVDTNYATRAQAAQVAASYNEKHPETNEFYRPYVPKQIRASHLMRKNRIAPRGYRRSGRSADIRPIKGNMGREIIPILGYQGLLKQNGKVVLKLSANHETYDRLLVAVDLWTRGATVAQVEKAVGKHING